MQLESLLLTRDPEVIRVLGPTLEKLAIEVEVCRGARSGNEIIQSEKFDAVIVDCDDLDGGLDVLLELRKCPSNKSSVSFAILNGTSTHKAFELGANFVLQKPLTALSAQRCFSAAVGLMARGRRRYFRYPVEFAVSLSFGPEKQVKVTASNLSEGGMAIKFKGALPRTKLTQVKFSLPGTGAAEMEPKSELAWADGAGRAGIRFLKMPRESREHLENWLAEQPEPDTDR